MKYNWSIIGHEKQLKQIEEDIASGNLAHSYLLAGTNSIGKFTVAKKIAAILQCDNNFCHDCNACLQIIKGSHIDTVEFAGKDSIKIADVRKLIERASMTGQSNYKVFLVQSVERMTTEAANSFLKVLEEPPEKTIFILTTNNLRGLLPTIISRVRVVKFGSVSVPYLQEKLSGLYPESDPDTLEKVCLFSLGKTGKAVHLMENPDSLAKCIEIYHRVQSFLDHKNVVDRFQYVENLLGEDGDLETFFSILTHVLRSKILEGHTESKRFATIASEVDEASILLKKNINSRLVLENLMLSL